MFTSDTIVMTAPSDNKYGQNPVARLTDSKVEATGEKPSVQRQQSMHMTVVELAAKQSQDKQREMLICALSNSQTNPEAAIAAALNSPPALIDKETRSTIHSIAENILRKPASTELFTAASTVAAATAANTQQTHAVLTAPKPMAARKMPRTLKRSVARRVIPRSVENASPIKPSPIKPSPIQPFGIQATAAITGTDTNKLKFGPKKYEQHQVREAKEEAGVNKSGAKKTAASKSLKVVGAELRRTANRKSRAKKKSQKSLPHDQPLEPPTVLLDAMEIARDAELSGLPSQQTKKIDQQTANVSAAKVLQPEAAEDKTATAVAGAKFMEEKAKFVEEQDNIVEPVAVGFKFQTPEATRLSTTSTLIAQAAAKTAATKATAKKGNLLAKLSKQQRVRNRKKMKKEKEIKRLMEADTFLLNIKNMMILDLDELMKAYNGKELSELIHSDYLKPPRKEPYDHHCC